MKIGRVLRLVFAAVVVVLLATYLQREGGRIAAALTRTDPAAVAGSLVAVLAGLLASAMVWRALLADLGSRLPLRAALHVFFVGQLGKYVPGSVFAVAAQMELGREHGISRSRVGTASLLFMGVLVATGGLVVAATLPLTSPDALSAYGWVLGAVPVGLLLLLPPVLTRLVAVALRVLRREPLERPLSARGVGEALGWALLMWALYGVHLALLVRDQPHDGGPSLLLLSLGGYALAWTVGFLVILAPAGGGLRELVLVAALAPVLTSPAAAAVAVVSRLLMTGGDLLWAGAGVLVRPAVVRSGLVQQQDKAADV